MSELKEKRIDSIVNQKDTTGISAAKNDTIIGSKLGDYAVAIYDTPILNTPDFKKVYGGEDGKTLSFNSNGLIKELEYVAFPGTVFKILEEYKTGDHSILKVATDNYQIILGGTNIYVDSRFVRIQNTIPSGVTVMMPSKKEIYDYLDSSVGTAYVWGGNNVHGIDKMLEFYKPTGKVSDGILNHWKIKGVDCSGLMYEATKGYTPRNTHTLINFGQSVKIEGKAPKEIAKLLDSLDMIVWKGHVIYVYDKHTTIESSHSSGGVVMKDLVTCLTKLMKTRTPADEWDDSKGKMFVVRRWW